MKPNTKLTVLAAAVSLATLLAACGSGGGSTDTAGIGGSGITSTGTITGFGSVFVNGVKFETTNSSFDIEGMDGTQDDLAIGMVVQVNGTINADGVTGTATRIIFDDELQGSVANFELATDGLTATFDVLGIAVLIDSKTTYFDDDGGAISINTISNRNMVELSGFFDATNTLIASRIERKENEEDRNKVEIKGTITNPNMYLDPNTNTLLINNFTAGITVDTSGITITHIQKDNFVEVEGRYDRETNTITATKIELEEFEYGDNDELEIEGFVTDYVSDSNFKVNGIIVDASHAEMEPSNMQLANNPQVEVEGRFDNNGVLIAEEIKMRGGDVEVSAYISSIDAANNRFEVTPIAGQPSLVIHTGPETQFENDITNSYSVRINNLSVGQFIEVEGFQNADGSIFASEVEISDPDDIEVQGTITSFTGTTITILGLEFETNGSTQFESDDNSITSLNTLRDLVNNPNYSENILVEIKLSNSSTNIIRKIEIED